MASPTSPESSLPTRSATMNTNDSEDIIGDEDSTETTKLFRERLQAWKGAVDYLVDYVESTEKVERGLGKDYEKVLKTVNSPLKLGQHFHQQNGGIAEVFDNIRSNTQGIANSHAETSKALKGSVLPTFERLASDVKTKTKGLDKGAGKASKAVEKARNDTQKHAELLGQHTASFDSRGGNVKAAEDPYLLQRGVYHRLHKQVLEENNNRDDTIAVQNEFASFEAHVIKSIQAGLQQFNQVMSNSSDQQRNMYGDMTAVASRIPPDFEWQGFVRRNNNILIDPNGPKRSIENISFANQDHPATRPLIAGSLERKGKLLKKYDTAYYVVTPSKYLHEFKSDDDFNKDPTPENSLFLPDCLIGAVDGTKFNVKGKDLSKGALSKMSMSHEFQFKAHTPEDARQWHDVIQSVAGGTSNSTPSSPAVAQADSFSPQSQRHPSDSYSTQEQRNPSGSYSSQGPQSPETDHSMMTGSTAHEPGVESRFHETDLAGNPLRSEAPLEHEKGVGGSSGGFTDHEKRNDYAPL